jgi:hypothetical protein
LDLGGVPRAPASSKTFDPAGAIRQLPALLLPIQSTADFHAHVEELLPILSPSRVIIEPACDKSTARHAAHLYGARNGNTRAKQEHGSEDKWLAPVDDGDENRRGRENLSKDIVVTTADGM